MGKKTKGTENYCLVSLQRSEDKVGEEKETQENTPTQKVGQKEINNREWGMSREEGKISREVKGKQNEENGRSLKDSDRESFSGKVLRETLSF